MIQRFSALRDQLSDSTLQLIIVNDGSIRGVASDSELLLQEALGPVQWISYPDNRGKGFALRKGLEQAQAPIVIYTDIDFPYTTGSMEAIVRVLQRGDVDLSVGVRDDTYYQKIPASRKRISKLLRTMNRFLFGLTIADTQCGLKGMNHLGRQLFLETTIDRYLFDLELVMQASRDKSISMIPVTVHLQEGVELSPVQSGLLFKELKNFARLFVKRWF